MRTRPSRSHSFIRLSVAVYFFLQIVSGPVHIFAEDFTISDGRFGELGWSLTTLRDTGPQPAIATVVNELSGGFPGRFRRITHEWTGPGAVTLAHLSDQAHYDIPTEGAINSVDFSFKIVLFEGGTSRVVSYAGLIKQGENYYRTPTTSTDMGLILWTSASYRDLVPADFTLISGDGPEVPNFSTSGAPLQFGFITSNGRSFAGSTRTESGIDNWSVEIQSNGETTKFLDGEFQALKWTSDSEIVDPSEASFDVQLAATGGNTGAFREVTHTWTGPGTIGVTHIREGQFYAPQVNGPIRGLSFDFDLILFDGGSSNVTAYSAAIRQAGVVFISPSVPTSRTLNTWTPREIENLTANDFDRLGTDGPPHPDFSEQAPPIYFGYYSSNGRSVPGQTQTVSGIDNWTVTVQNPPPVVDIRVTGLRVEDGQIVADFETSSGKIDIYRAIELTDFGLTPFKTDIPPGPSTVIDTIVDQANAFYRFKPHSE